MGQTYRKIEFYMGISGIFNAPKQNIVECSSLEYTKVTQYVLYTWSIQVEFGKKTGRILIGCSMSSQASLNTSEYFGLRGVRRSVFGRIWSRIFGFCAVFDIK